jgi:hypothetical protein
MISATVRASGSPSTYIYNNNLIKWQELDSCRNYWRQTVPAPVTSNDRTKLREASVVALELASSAQRVFDKICTPVFARHLFQLLPQSHAKRRSEGIYTTIT